MMGWGEQRSQQHFPWSPQAEQMEFRMGFEGNVGVCQVGESGQCSSKGTRSQRRSHGCKWPEGSGHWGHGEMSWRGRLGRVEKGMEESAEEPAPLGMYAFWGQSCELLKWEFQVLKQKQGI